MPYFIDFETVSSVSQQYVAKKLATVKKLIGFFTLTKEEKIEAGIVVGGEGRADETPVGTLSSPERT